MASDKSVYIPPQKTARIALPIRVGSGPKAVLLVHGYTGVPGDYRYLAPRLADAGFAVEAPRLPGHGTSGLDLLTTGRRDWLRHLRDCYLDLAGAHASVAVVGLSMGGLLAIHLAAEFQPTRLVLAAPALRVNEPLLGLTPLLRWFVHSLPKKDWVFDGDEAFREVANEYWSREWLVTAAELVALQRRARRLLPLVRSRTLVIVSRADKTVPYRVADYVEKRMPLAMVHRLTLKQSEHNLVDGKERETVAEAVMRWLSD